MTDLMQDGPGCAEGRRYARWFADRLDAMWLLRKAHNERKTTMTTPDLTEARRLADEWEPKRPGISGVLRDLAAEVERLRAQVAAWESELSAVMPADFKDWHQNSRSEWPAVAADVIRSQREDRDLGWEMAARAQVAPDVDALAQHIRRVNGNNDMGAGALAESIVEWLAAAPAQQAHPESFADQALASETATSRPTPSLTVGERFQTGYEAAINDVHSARQADYPLVLRWTALAHQAGPKARIWVQFAEDSTEVEFAPAQPAAQAEPVAELPWQRLAIAWLKGQAAKQAQTNQQYPDHAKCYPRWTAYVETAERLAEELESEFQFAAVQAGKEQAE